MTIIASELGVPDQTLARRILVYARTVIAPRLDELEGNSREDAIAILTGVAREAQARGPRGITSQGVGSASVRYESTSTWFTEDDRQSLRALCARELAGIAASGHPIGVFPKPPRVFKAVWPEEE